jgi:hypothetical protein
MGSDHKSRDYDDTEAARLLDDFLDGKEEPTLRLAVARSEAARVVQAFVRIAEHAGYLTGGNPDGSVWIGIAHRPEQAVIRISPEAEISVAEPGEGKRLGAVVKLRLNRTTKRLEAMSRTPDGEARSPVAVLAEAVLQVMKECGQRDHEAR